MRRIVLSVFLLTWTVAVISAATARSQDTPPQPPPPTAPEKQNPPANPTPSDETKGEEKKDDGSNPAQAAADKAKEITVQAAQATKDAAQQALNKARDWETGWFTGGYIEKGRRRVPLTSAERRELYLQQTLTSPSDYMKRMFGAAIDQARGVPKWQGGWGGYGERFASREGQFISANSIAALGNAVLKYEPRYDQCMCSGFWPRTRHAIVRNFVTYDQSERHLRPQWALYGGSFAGGLIATSWKPNPPGAWTNAGYAVLGQAGYGALLNFFVEFAADINKKIGAKKIGAKRKR